MGTELSIELEGIPREQAITHSEKVLNIVRSAEERMSTWKQTSELSKLNQAKANQPIPLSPELSSELSAAWECETETHGAFSAALAPLIEAWGMRTGGKIPDSKSWKTAFQNSGSIHFDRMRNHESGVITVTKKMDAAGIEEGGFGKGAALDQAMNYLNQQKLPHAILNFGGQIAQISHEPQWIEVADPSNRQHTLLKFKTRSASVATTSNSVHRNAIQIQGRKKKLGHLLNPFTGKPFETDASITVLHHSALKADCHTKVLIFGKTKALEWAHQHAEKILILTPAQKSGQWIAETSCDWTDDIQLLSPFVQWKKHNPCTTKKERKL